MAGNIWLAALLHWCWWRSHVEAGCVCLMCGRGSLVALLPGTHTPPFPSPQLISELNSTSLPAVVESDRNIFYSQTVAIIFSMLFYFVSCITMVQTLLREEKCSQKTRELQTQVRQFKQIVFGLDGQLLWVPTLFMVELTL